MGYETCQPEKYMSHMNNECYTNCPVFCAENEMQCPGGVDPYTGFCLVKPWLEVNNRD